MKKVIFAMFILIALSFMACDNGSTGGNGDINVVGFWDGTVSFEGMVAPVTFQFKSDGTYEFTARHPSLPGGSITAYGTYSVSGNVLTISDDMGDSTATVEKDKFILLDPRNFGPNPVTFTRR